MGKGEGKGKGGDDVCACCAAVGAATLCCLIVLVVLGLVGLGIAKIVIGAIYLHDCSIEDKIPIFLIVGALAPILFGGFGKKNDDENEGFGVGTICGIIGFLFNIAWLIAGSIWVYGTWSTVKSDTYVPCSHGNATEPGCTEGTCNNVLLTFAFATCTIDWILTGVWIVFIGCMIMRACSSR